MENYFKPQEDKSDSVISKDNIITKISILTGKQNLSLNVSSSKQMTDLIQTCIQFGMQNPKSDVKKLYNGVCSDTIRKYLISSAIDINKIQIKRFSSLTFVGLSVDEGSQKGIH